MRSPPTAVPTLGRVPSSAPQSTSCHLSQVEDWSVRPLLLPIPPYRRLRSSSTGRSAPATRAAAAGARAAAVGAAAAAETATVAATAVGRCQGRRGNRPGRSSGSRGSSLRQSMKHATVARARGRAVPLVAHVGVAARARLRASELEAGLREREGASTNRSKGTAKTSGSRVLSPRGTSEPPTTTTSGHAILVGRF
eukprot:scaffold25784_cov59-Phaeocystis_antarctica.AAC.1